MKLTGYYTTAGEKIAAGLLAGETLSVSRIAAGSGSTALSAAALSQEQQDLGPCEPEVSGTTAVMRCTLSSDQASAPYFLRELGVYALDAAGKEVLYLIFRLDEEVSINPAFRLVLRFNLEQTLSDGAGVKVTAPLTGLATQEELKTKADLQDGFVPYEQLPHLTGSKNLFVNAATGSDDNPGTEAAPLKTIQAAIDSLPKDLGAGGGSISVAAGVYDEDVVIRGFYGGRDNDAINIVGATTMDDTRNVRSFAIVNTGCVVNLRGMCITGAQSGVAVSVFGAKASLMDLHLKSGGEENATGVAVGVWSPAQASIQRCTVEGYSSSGLLVDRASLVDINATEVKNCGYGIKVGGGASGTTGIVILSGVTYEGNTTDTVAVRNGQIFGGA